MVSLLSITIFLGFGILMILAGLLAGKVVRPHLPHPQKAMIYECGESPIGSSWVQFDLRFYIVALFFLVFDVEVALLYPWAVVFRQMPLEALLLGAPFISIVVVGFLYEWRSGSLNWVRGVPGAERNAAQQLDEASASSLGFTSRHWVRPLPGKLSQLARRDPGALEEETLTLQKR